MPNYINKKRKITEYADMEFAAGQAPNRDGAVVEYDDGLNLN